MRRIAIASAKGGTGKTTTAVSLAHALALAGRTVTVVDCDPQRHAALHFGIAADLGVAALLQGGEARSTEVRQGLWVVDSGGAALARLERGLPDNIGSAGELRRALQCVDAVDYLLLDCPPSLGPLHVNALVACDEVLLPVGTDFLGLEGVTRLLTSVRLLAQEVGVRPRLLGILPTFYDPNASSTADIERLLRARHAGHVLQTRVHLTDELRAAPAHQRSVFEHEPLSHGARDYAELALEIEDLAA